MRWVFSRLWGFREGSDYGWTDSQDLLKGVGLEQNLKDEEDSEG